jgi:hypothetical protein
MNSLVTHQDAGTAHVDGPGKVPNEHFVIFPEIQKVRFRQSHVPSLANRHQENAVRLIRDRSSEIVHDLLYDGLVKGMVHVKDGVFPCTLIMGSIALAVSRGARVRSDVNTLAALRRFKRMVCRAC